MSTPTFAALDLAAPFRLWLLAVVVALALGYVASLRWRRGATVRFTRVDLLDEVAPERPQWRRHLVAVLMLVGLTMLVIAAAEPVDRTTERTRTDGRIVLAIDVSLSMMATDVEPDRLTAAQAAAREFVAEVDDGVEIALVSFSGTVTVEVPLTTDRSAVAAGIDRLELAEATAIGDALAVSTRVLESAADATPVDERDPDLPIGTIVLLTDGETTVGRPTVEGARLAGQAGVPVYSIAFGTAGGAILDPGGSGQVIPVPVRPDELRVVSELTGGSDFAAETAGALEQVYDEIRDTLGDTLGDEVEVVVDRSGDWATAAFAAIALAWGLSLWWLRGLV